MVAAIIAFVVFIIGAGLSWEIWQGIKKAEEPIENQEKAFKEKREELRVLYSELGVIPMDERDTKRKEIQNKRNELRTEREKLTKKVETEQVGNYLKLISTIVGTFYLMILILITGAEKGLGLFSWMMIWALPIVIAFYILSSIKTVGADEKGLKLFMDLPYQEAKSGPNFVPLQLVQLLKLPTTVNYLKFEEDTVMLTGPESQPLRLNFSLKWNIKQLFDAVTTLGMSMDKISGKLEGPPEGSGEKGILRDRVAEISRSFFAKLTGKDALDKALGSREELVGALNEQLRDMLEYHGIECDVIVGDINPADEMVKARLDKTTTKVEVETAKEKRKVKFEEGAAKIDVIKHLKQEIPEAERIVPLISVMMLGEDAIGKLMEGAGKLNIYLAPALQELFAALKGGSTPEINESTQKLLEFSEDEIRSLIEFAKTLSGKDEKK